MKLGEKYGPKFGFGAWSRTAEIDGVVYHVGISRGSTRIRIPYKPVGKGAYGYHWRGFVRDAAGKTIWSGRVNKSIGARGLLGFAGVIRTAITEKDRP